MPERLNNVLSVIWSCIKMHATSDGARFLTRAFLYQSVIGTRCEACAIKCPKNIKNRSVQLVARNREYSKGLNNVPCVIWSCIKMHATSDGARFLMRAFLYLSVIGTCCEACTIKCPENKSAVDFPSVFNTSKIHRTFFFFF